MVITAQECAPSERDMETWTAEDVHIWLRDQMYVSNSAMVAKSALTAGLTGQDLQLLDTVALEFLGITHPLEQVRVKAVIKNFTPDNIKDSTAYQIPVVNIFFDLLFDDSPPSNEQLKDMLNTFGLLAALLLTVAMSIPASFDYDELDDALERFEVAPYAAYLNGTALIQELQVSSAVGVFGLGATIIAVVVMLIITAIPQWASQSKARIKYWHWARWTVLWIILNLILGAFGTFQAFNRMVMLKFPDFYLAEHSSISVFNPESSFGFFFGLGLLWLLLPLIIILLGMGWAHRQVHIAMLSLRASEEAGTLTASSLYSQPLLCC